VVAGALPQPPQLRISSPGKGLLYHPAGVPFRKFDEEVLRTLRVPSASPLPRLDSLLGTVTRAGGGPPLPALRCAQRGASVATGGCARVRGGGGGRPRPFGMLPWRGREAARRDHQPQLVYELMRRDTRRARPPVRWRWPCSFRSRRAGVSEWPEPVVSPAPSLQRPTRPPPVRPQSRFLPRQAQER